MLPHAPVPLRRRAEAGAFALTLFAAAWLGMMAVHELGHVLHAHFSGGCVTRVVLHPLAFSRTDLSDNPHPLLVAWGGVLWGSALPLVAWLATFSLPTAWQRARLLVRFFAGFCLIANGAYLATAALRPVGDSEDLLRLGAPLWLIVPPGVLGMAAGLALWNRTGRGLGFSVGVVDRQAWAIAAAVLALEIAGMLWWSGRA